MQATPAAGTTPISTACEEAREQALRAWDWTSTWARNGVTAVEWAERAARLLPAHTIHVRLRVGEHADERVIEISEGQPS
jgi:tRNA A37 threonylcarbamoyladenosine biosynthesis protein TsaE